MRPGQIRVFDGLRVTTEHVNHFQASLHSAIQDIREILGLGAVHAGFGVVPTANDSVTVQPGLAFDHQRNRIVCDQPQQLAISFAPDQTVAYVCAKYDQIEGGETEGRQTLIWDSCAVLLRPAMPEPADNVVALAMLTRREDGTFAVSDLTSPVTLPPAPARDDADPPKPSEWSVRQEVLNFALPSVPASVSSLLAAAAGRRQPSATGDLSAELAAAELPAGFAWTSVTTYAALSATVNAPTRERAPSSAEVPSDRVSAVDSPAPSRVPMTVRGSSIGEATLVGGAVSQFAMNTNGEASGELSDNVMFNLPLDVDGTAAALPVNDDAGELIARMRLFVRVEPSGGTAFKVAVHLGWSGAWSADTAQRLDEHKPTLTWTGRLAWKAVGRPTA